MALMPKTATTSGFSGDQIARQILDFSGTIEAYCDSLLDDVTNPKFDLQLFENTINVSQQLLAILNDVDTSQEKNAILASCEIVWQAQLGRNPALTQGEIGNSLRDFSTVLDTFITDAIAGQPKDATSGAILKEERDTTDPDITKQKLIAYLAPRAQTGPQISQITALRAGIEP